jgi:DNA-binding MarR family transcriptional regulator
VKTHLSAIQSRILVALFQSDGRQQFVRNETVLENTGIAQSTWSEEQKRLIDMGLLEKKAFKTIRTNNVCRIVNFRLTSKGRTVAFNLANISRMIFQQQNGPTNFSTGGQVTLSEKELQFEVMESIEVALDSFGINLIPLVKSRMPEGTVWEGVGRNPGILISILRDLFGKEGSSTVESMIVENLKARFDVEGPPWENELIRLIEALREKFVVDNLLSQQKVSAHSILELSKSD